MKTQPANVTPFLLDGRRAIDALDQLTMRRLTKLADFKRVTVVDIISLGL